MQIVVGLGNPGEKYKNTRHNVGFIAVDFLAKQKNANWTENKKFQAIIAQSGETIYLKPLTFMNDSGRAVNAILSYYDLLPKKLGILKKKNSDLSPILTVIHDDSDQMIGKKKIVSESGTAGHRGLESIIQHLKTKKFKRIKIGIRPEKLMQAKIGHHVKAEEFVLKNFSKEELIIINEIIQKILL